MPHKIHAVQPVASIDHTRPIAVGRGQGFSPNLLLALALNSIILLIQDLALFRDKKSSIELENAELKIKNMEAANHRLKQQIHPHFLFNSLNTLKTLIKNEPEKAEDYLVNLSEFLRASLSNTMNIVALCDEIELAVNYLEMQAIRFGDALHYTINIPEEIQQTGFVPALSIQPLLENAIKHNILTKVLPLYITVTYHEDWLTVANTLQPKTTTDSGAGLGLHNLSERYKILSDNDIVIVKSHEQFSVSIKILDNASSHHRG
jgi:LytS/YehU family sensor histidine kinase